jgi:phosphatidate cytidylyltransferase
VVIAAFALAAGLFEFYSLTKKLQLKADAGMGYLGAALLFVGFVFDAPTRQPDLILASLAAFFIALLISQTFRFQADFSKMLTGIGVTMLGVMYVAFLGGFLISVRTGFENRVNLSTHLLGYFFIVIFASDTGAYFSGRAFGKHKLAPAISPGKTVEGLIGGVIAACLGAAIATATFFPELPYAASIPLAIVLAVIGVLGDLAESAMKRGSKTKDAASILPGHGGLLDRLDSLLFGAPILYYFARYYF